jgi:hypothetical protein
VCGGIQNVLRACRASCAPAKRLFTRVRQQDAAHWRLPSSLPGRAALPGSRDAAVFELGAGSLRSAPVDRPRCVAGPGPGLPALAGLLPTPAQHAMAPPARDDFVYLDETGRSDWIGQRKTTGHSFFRDARHRGESHASEKRDARARGGGVIRTARSDHPLEAAEERRSPRSHLLPPVLHRRATAGVPQVARDELRATGGTGPERAGLLHVSMTSTSAYLRPIAKRLRAVRTYITPSDSAGVAISSSPIAFVAISLNPGPAVTTRMSPSSFER